MRARSSAPSPAAETELGAITILVNNAGVATTASFLDQTEDQWRAVLDTNLDGARRVAQAAARRMAAHGHGGAIVNIASILGLRPAGGVSAYAAAKAGLVSLTQTMALELARHKIRVNALAPGYVATDLNRDFLTEPGRGGDGQAGADAPFRRAGGPRRRPALACVRCGALHDGQHRRRRWRPRPRLSLISSREHQ